MKILELEDIHTYYGDSHVIQGLSMYVDKGEAVSLLGRNGVGKTTTLRSIMSLTPPRRGTVRIGGTDCTRWPTHRIAKEGRVAYIPADRQIFPGLSVDENLKLSQRQPLEGCEEDAWTKEKVYENFPRLKDRYRQDGSTLSGGEQQMLAIARGLMGNPEIMLLDEPSQGLAPIIVAMVVEIVKRLCSIHQLTLVLVEQNFRVAYKLASRHYLMDVKGQIRRTLTRAEWTENQDIVKRHLSVE
jgi:branched-chain amino acid transport system ATP-binding protein